MKGLLREMARIAEEDGMPELARALEKDAEPARPIRSRGWAESMYRMRTPKKAP